MRHHILIILILLLFTSMQALGVDKKFRNFNLDDGLSSSTVSCFYKAKNKLVWIGTGKGVDLFTGQEFIPLQHFINDSVGAFNASITSITELENNILWIGTWGEGLLSVNIETGDFKHYQRDKELNPYSISDNYINNIEVYDNQLWIASNFGLSQTSGNGQFNHYTFQEVLSRHSADIRAVIPRYEHLLSVFTDAGEILELNSQTGAYKKVAEINQPIKNITKIIRDKHGRYWIGTAYLGLLLLDENYNVIPLPGHLQKELEHSRISDILVHNEYGIFVSSDGGGLFIIDVNTFDWQVIKENANVNSLSNNQLESLYFDSDGILWIGYYKDGFSKSIYKGDGIRHIQKSAVGSVLPNKSVNCFTEDYQQNLWVGTERGISILDTSFKEIKAKNVQLKAISRLNNLPITSLSANNNSTIVYAGTYNDGLFCIDLKKNRISHFNKTNSSLKSNFIRNVSSYNDSIKFVATVDGGLYKFNGTEFENVKVFYQHNYEILDFLDIKLIDSQNIWIASAGKGIFRINTAIGSGEAFSSVESTICYNTCLTKDSTLFLATNKGVYKYNTELDDFKLLNGSSLNIDFYGILEESDNYLWLSSSDGLFRYDRITEVLQKISSINIQGKQFLPGAVYKMQNNCYLFGGTNGFNAITPQNFKLDSDSTSLFFSEFKIYNKTIKPGNTYNNDTKLLHQINYTPELTIPYNIDLFSITVKSINYLSGDDNQIAYTIKDGNKLSNLFYTDGEIAFLNMKPGKYQLNIYPISSINKHIISESAKVISIQKQSPWWHSPWIYVALFVLIFSTILILYRIRVREYRKTKRLLQKKVTERTATLLSQKERLQKQKNDLQIILAKNKKLESFKESIINMIIHDLKNPLNSIIGLSSLNEAEGLEHINSASRQMLCLVENILDVRRYETHSLQLFYQQCDIRLLVNEAIEEVRFLLKNNQIEIINLTNSMVVELDKDIMRRVYINLLTNAIKYSQVNGKITLRGQLHQESPEKTLLLSVQDEGPGISKKYQESIFDLYQQIDTKKSGQAYSNGLGLSFCKMAVNEHRGKIWVDSEIGRGATFFMEIPSHKPNPE